MIFDGASAIDDLIWDVTEGALTDAKTQILWLRYGNPTKTSGRFFKNCTQGKAQHLRPRRLAHRQLHQQKQIEAWIEEYGEGQRLRARARQRASSRAPATPTSSAPSSSGGPAAGGSSNRCTGREDPRRRPGALR